MTETNVGVNLQPEKCFPFYARMTNCMKTEDNYARMCLEEIEDWRECKGKGKARAFNNYMSQEMRKVKVYSLPQYDESTDTFKDGPLPKDVDGYFSKDKNQRHHYA